MPAKSAEPETRSPAPVPSERPAGLPVSVQVGQGGKELTIDLGNGVKMEFVLIPAGEFTMGSSEAERQIAIAQETEAWVKDRIGAEGPQHKVKISRPFYLGKYEVTQAQWQAVMGNNPSQFQGPMNPVEQVSWDDVQEFLAKLNAVVGRVSNPSSGTGTGSKPVLPAGTAYKAVLPTEAQWEYACRAGTTTAFCFGDDPAMLNDYGWSSANAGGKTHPVGQRKPNAWGLFDMHGNVWEWCSDWWGADYYAKSPPVDPVGLSAGLGRAVRGGGCHYPPKRCRAAWRHVDPPGGRRVDLGFRLALVSAGEATETVAQVGNPATDETAKKPTPGPAVVEAGAGAESTQSGTALRAVSDGTESRPTLDQRLPVPPAAEQARMARQFDDVYKLSERRSPQEQLELAKRLFQLGRESQGGPVEKFVYFCKAMETAGKAGNARLMLEVVDAMSAEFEVDALEGKQKVLADFIAGKAEPERIAACLDAADPVIAEALGAAKHDVALGIAEAAYRASQQSGDKDLRKRAFERRNDVRKQGERLKEVATARETLRASPDDAAANLAVGCWLSFERGDWEQGLPHLAKSSSAALKAVAAEELGSPPKDADAQVRLADAWWALAEKVEGKDREALMLHAGDWYAKAAAVLPKGFAKEKVESRLKDIAKIERPAGEKPGKPAAVRGSPDPAHPQANVPKLPKQLTIDVPGGVKMEFVLIPAGEFIMGSPEAERQAALAEMKDGWEKDRIPTESPQHKVKINGPFYLGKYEVTQAQWQAVIGNNPSKYQGPTNPVEQVSWEDIQPFLAKLNTLFERKGMRFTLPTEAQWEYACRAGTTTAFCFGDDAALLNEYGWYTSNSGRKTHPVGQGKPNAWGLFDMHGNVWEWCADWYGEDYYAQSAPVDPVGPPGGSGRVFRGGAWDRAPGLCRAAFRYLDGPGHRFGNLGFRLALVPTDAAAGGVKPAQPEPAGPPKVDSPQASTASKELAIDLPGGVKMEFVLIPAGEFVMGSPEAERQAALVEAENANDDWAKDRIPTEGPQHKVKISRPSYLGKYEVTQAQWQAVMGNNPSQFQGPMNPVEKVSWEDIQLFMAKLNAAFEKKGMLFGLPTEAGWEYACRAGTTTAYCFGDNAALLNDYGWSGANAGGKTHPVGQGKPNAWGLYDMHGNVWEWCSDWAGKDYYAVSPPVDPVGPPGGSIRVIRGGSWDYPPRSCRAAFRAYAAPGNRGGSRGIRAALIVRVDAPSK
jgi:formylglycine-generating enzyme required for sulfatase activity